MGHPVKTILNRWRSQPIIAENVIEWRVLAEKPADFSSFPEDLSKLIVHALENQNIEALYEHQAAAYRHVVMGENIAVVSGTASGKTLCYNLPVIDSLIKHPGGRALYLYPTKALTQDQLNNLNSLINEIAHTEPLTANIYDGDTPQHTRSSLRKNTAVILSNPDMLHTGILPHHTGWKEFLSGLRYIVLDEMHIYRGVFGSHLANVIRRLKRICRFYGSQPQFILTSATIANPKDLAENLIEKPVTVIDIDGSPHGERHFLVYNPPFIDQKLGIRKSSLLEGSFLAGELISENIQTIIFSRTRRSVELILTYLRDRYFSGQPNQVRGYRSGYLPKERRAIEAGLRNGQVQGVVATSALELGIDIGGMDAAVLIGYPGSIAATLQQAGRAGRKRLPSLAILVASANAMDQYLAAHPSYFFERSPEKALIAPNNLLILLQHIRCAAFELPFQSNEGFGAVSDEKMQPFLKLLSQSGELHEQGTRYFWMSDQYPAAEISLRNASPDQISLTTEADQQIITIGQVDLNSAYWMVHPEAVYLHEGATFFVEDLDLETGTAHLKPAQVDYYTQAISETQVEIQNIHQSRLVKGGEKSLGEINVTNQVTGYRKIRWFTHEQLGQGKVDLPETSLNTVGFWIMLNNATINQLKDKSMWSAEPNDYGYQWESMRIKVIHRDGNRCQVCSASGENRPLHVHHIQPFKSYANLEAANQLQNLITLCPTCHQLAEINVRIRSGLAGYSYLLHNLAPLLVMCDGEDIGVHYDPKAVFGEGKPSVILYDNIPGGLGLSESLYERHATMLDQGYETINYCACADGCPSCVGPIGDGGSGGKQETLAIFKALIDHD